jgi:hypothetical protein
VNRFARASPARFCTCPAVGDPVIEAIITDELARLRSAMLDTMGLSGQDRYVASAALLGWLAFVREICVEWLAQRRLSRA